jgi:Na+-transporting NADH:ubiquinone oxidoreductase subunit NqrF
MSSLSPSIMILAAVGLVLAVVLLLAMFSLISMGTSLKSMASEQKKQDERLAQILDTLLASMFASGEE